MKKQFKTGSIYLASALIALTSVGCGQDKNANSKATSQEAKAPKVNTLESKVINNYKLAFDFDPSWNICEDVDSYDLTCQNDLGYFHAILYNKKDLKEGLSPEELLDYHVSDLISKLTNPEVIEESTSYTTTNAQVIRQIHSAEQNILKVNYLFYVLSFDTAPDMLALVIANAVPSDYEKQKSRLDDIINSVQIVKVESETTADSNSTTSDAENADITTISEDASSTEATDTQTTN